MYKKLNQFIEFLDKFLQSRRKVEESKEIFDLIKKIKVCYFFRFLVKYKIIRK